jgi:branched-chain amino acid transport system substrate-binding protein
MGDQRNARRRAHRVSGRGLAIAVLSTALLAGSACGGDDDDSSAPSGPEEPSASATDLLGPVDQASGEPVRIGFVSDGQTPALDASVEIPAAEATAAFWNEHRGGVGGRPVEVVTCETSGDPAGGTDCGNRMVEEDVVAAVISASGVTDSVWEPMHAAGIPLMVLTSGTGEAMLADDQSTFLVFSSLTAGYGLPASIAQSEGVDKVAFVVIDVPVALTQFESGQVDRVLEDAGLEYDLVRVPPGTADMTSQMSEIANSDAGVTMVIGNDTFCIAAFQGLAAAGYDGELATLSYCLTDATREALSSDQLEGLNVLSAVALGAANDPTNQLYEAVMAAYGDDVENVEDGTVMAGYSVMAALLTSLEGISGDDITPQTAAETIKTMPEEEVPGAGGVTFQCGGSADPSAPAICTTQWLRAQVGDDGELGSYEVFDSADLSGAQ